MLNPKHQDDIDFVRYMAENFASFDYKTQEEVLTVLKYLTSILSTSGMQLVEALSPAHLLKQLHESSQPEAQVRRLYAGLSVVVDMRFPGRILRSTSVYT